MGDNMKEGDQKVMKRPMMMTMVNAIFLSLILFIAAFLPVSLPMLMA